jgi:nitrous oxidase accessory protein
MMYGRPEKSALSLGPAVLAAIGLSFCLMNCAFCEVFTVGPGRKFTLISRAIEAASPGDTIKILPGIYKEDIVLKKKLALEGSGWPEIYGTGNGSVITVLADGCSIRDLKIRHSGGSLQEEHSGILLKSNKNHIEGNRLDDVLFGIYFFQSAQNLVRSNSIIGRVELDPGDRGAGFHLWNSIDNVVENNTVRDARDGMYIQNSPGSKIRGNRITHLRYGVHFMYSDSNEFEGNTFSGNTAGAAIMYSKNITFRRNVIVRNRGFSSFGILLQDCTNCLAEENLIIDNGTGIFLEAVSDGIFRKNVIAGNNLALQIFSSSERNRFVSNNFVDNLSPLQIVGRKTSTQWSDEGKGNYWSDYDGYDLNEDGVGDVGHKVQNIFEYMEGNFPRLRLYLSSPAANALAIAERTFPVVKGSDEIDHFPLMKPAQLPDALDQKRTSESGSWLRAGFSLSIAGAIIFFIRKEQRR